jgi:ribosome-binding factor A
MIQQEVASIILRDLNDPRVPRLTSVTRVKVSEDLSAADVYVTVMGSEGQQTAALNALRHSAGLMRTRLTKTLTLRVAPYLKFHLDENLKKELEVLDLLRKARAESEEFDRRQAGAEPAASDESAPIGGAGEAAGHENAAGESDQNNTL